jgi:hypothetical protein
MVPRRVMRLKVAADGRSIVGVMPLDVSHPAFDDLGQGVVADDGLFFVANSQNALYDKNGVLTDPVQLEPTSVFRSNLRFAWDQTGVGTDVAPGGGAKPGDAHKPQPQPTKPASDAAKPASSDGKH